MDCCRLKMPHSLYELSVSALIEFFQYYKQELRILPENILFDVYYMLYKEKRLCLLGLEFSDLDVFSRMLKVTNKRLILLKSFQSLMDHGTRVAKELATSYAMRCSSCDQMTPAYKDSTISLGIRLGGFLSDAGWYAYSEKVLSACRTLCESLPESCETWRIKLECCHRLLHAQALFARLEAAEETRALAEKLVKDLMLAGETMNLAGLYTEFSLHSFCKSNYDESFKWSVQAINELGPGVSNRVTIYTLSQAAKACVIKREFNMAGILVRQAVYLAREIYGSAHPTFADTLLAYGFYLLNSDSIKHSVMIYEEALQLKKSLYGRLNLQVAVAQEDLAYALYVHEYSSGMFRLARENAEKAISTMMQLLPEEHLLLASAKRVKALILEEIALDNIPGNSCETQTELLDEAEKLHIDALRLARIAFGEDNVQTAKHYGNLGRLYQSMKKYQEAEIMHLKAISIKEKILGPDDYEVGLSVGHLASLYNYHMKEYRKAEQLYVRSITINLKLFSETYSGLEYDYRGLMHVYDKLGAANEVAEYTVLLARWRELREQNALRDLAPLTLAECPTPLKDIKELFGSIKNKMKQIDGSAFSTE